jgi:hypothetical protein
MYADDIVLLSSTPQVLQTKLNSLAKYCDEWCLQLNPSKTKVLVFSKAGRLIKNQKFTFSEHDIECVQHCKYLGIYVSASGNFSFATVKQYHLHTSSNEWVFHLGIQGPMIYPNN